MEGAMSNDTGNPTVLQRLCGEGFFPDQEGPMIGVGYCTKPYDHSYLLPHSIGGKGKTSNKDTAKDVLWLLQWPIEAIDPSVTINGENNCHAVCYFLMGKLQVVVPCMRTRAHTEKKHVAVGSLSGSGMWRLVWRMAK